MRAVRARPYRSGLADKHVGTDIDKIMIKSDSEGKTTGAARSYNYRVRRGLTSPLWARD